MSLTGRDVHHVSRAEALDQHVAGTVRAYVQQRGGREDELGGHLRGPKPIYLCCGMLWLPIAKLQETLPVPEATPATSAYPETTQGPESAHPEVARPE